MDQNLLSFFFFFTILIMALTDEALTPCQTPQACEAGPVVISILQMRKCSSLGGGEGGLIPAAPMSLNGKTPDTRGTNNSGFANTKEKMLSSHAPPPTSPKAQNFWEGPVPMT